MSLQTQIDKKRKEIYSDRMSMSIGELAGLYERGEIDTHPKFQRFLRWSEEQKTKLIESILLRIPIPPIFVAQDVNGYWDIVDGVQRLGTVLEFIGVLKDATGNLKVPLVLSETKLLPELKGKAFVNRLKPNEAFTIPQQLDFKRSRLDLHIILKESDPSSKFELFERLNTGGSLASAQEVRNCVMVWINESMFDWMTSLKEDLAFKECVQISDRLEELQYRMELVLRFIVFRQLQPPEFIGDDLAEFLNEQNRQFSTTGLDQLNETRVFTETFALLEKALGADVFRKLDSKGDFRGSFLISAFEAVALGVAYNLDRWKKLQSPELRIAQLVKEMWTKPEFIDHIGIGVSAKTRIRRSIPFGRSFFVP